MVIKKLIAISVVFALVAGAAFAIDLGGEVIGSVKIVDKAAGANTKVNLFNGGIGEIRLNGSGEADIGIGTLGGWLRLNAGSYGGGPQAYGLAYWQIIPALKLQIGSNPDGEYGVEHIGGHGMHGQAHDIGGLIARKPWDPVGNRTAIFGGGDAWHFALVITPIEALAINIGIPLNASASYKITEWTPRAVGYTPAFTDVSPVGTTIGGITPDSQVAAAFKGILFQANYTAGFGSIHFTFQGAGSTSTYETTLTAALGGVTAPATDPTGAGDKITYTGPAKSLGTFYVSTNLTLIENLGIEFGVSYKIGKSVSVTSGGDGSSAAANSDIGIGLAASYDIGSFGIKFRSTFVLNTKATQKVLIAADLLPSFKVNDHVDIFLDAGIIIPAKSTFGWHVAPYVRIGGNTYGPGFYAGIAANGTNKANSMSFAIPIGIVIGF